MCVTPSNAGHPGLALETRPLPKIGIVFYPGYGDAVFISVTVDRKRDFDLIKAQAPKEHLVAIGEAGKPNRVMEACVFPVPRQALYRHSVIANMSLAKSGH